MAHVIFLNTYSYTNTTSRQYKVSQPPPPPSPSLPCRYLPSPSPSLLPCWCVPTVAGVGPAVGGPQAHALGAGAHALPMVRRRLHTASQPDRQRGAGSSCTCCCCCSPPSLHLGRPAAGAHAVGGGDGGVGGGYCRYSSDKSHLDEPHTMAMRADMEPLLYKYDTALPALLPPSLPPCLTLTLSCCLWC